MKVHQTTVGETIDSALVRNGYKGRQEAFCKKAGIGLRTLQTRKRYPETITLKEYWSMDRYLHFTDDEAMIFLGREK